MRSATVRLGQAGRSIHATPRHAISRDAFRGIWFPGTHVIHAKSLKLLQVKRAFSIHHELCRFEHSLETQSKSSQLVTLSLTKVKHHVL